MTLGEKRLRIKFQPGNNDKVQNLKEKVARLINQVDKEKPTDPESARLKALALTSLEEASMWITKLLTQNT